MQEWRGGGGAKDAECFALARKQGQSYMLPNAFGMESRLSSEQLRENKHSLLNVITSYCMEHSLCRAQFMAKYFSELQGDVCKMCDICQKGMTHQINDFTNEAKNILECLTSMIVIQSKVKVNALAMAYMGSKVKEIIGNGFHMVSHYGNGKTSFRNISGLTNFIHFLIIKGFLNENVQHVEDRLSSTYLTPGKIHNLLNSTCKVFY